MTIRLTYVGHATVLIDVAGTGILTDPVIRPLVFGVIRRAVDPPPPIDPPPDAILISHQHPDHMDFKSLRAIGAGIPTLAPSGAVRRLRRHGITTIRGLGPGESARIGAAEVRATPAEHDGRRLPIGRRTPALGYELRAAGQRIYFAGDTDLFDGMADLRGVDLALLPIGSWGDRVGEGHLDPERAARAAAILEARAVVPIHWGTYLRSDLHRRHPGLLQTHAPEFEARMAELAPDTDAHVLRPGESLTLP